jgi:uncharacterized protein (TIGR02569 family)
MFLLVGAIYVKLLKDSRGSSMSSHNGPAPPIEVMEAFGAKGSVERFDSGEGRTFRVDQLVLKPRANPTEAEWIGDVLELTVEDGFRLARPIRAANGSWLFQGWTGWQWVKGQSTKQRWDDVITAGERFHHAVQSLRRPSFIDERTHQWAVGDRMAFSEAQTELSGPIGALVEEVQLRLGHLDLPSQVIHGDLTENVLLADSHEPAIIDFSPYYRPPGYATAIVVVDAIVWFAAPLSLIDRIQPAEARFELLARALIFRLVAAALYRWNNPVASTTQAYAYQSLVDYTVRALSST